MSQEGPAIHLRLLDNLGLKGTEQIVALQGHPCWAGRKMQPRALVLSQGDWGRARRRSGPTGRSRMSPLGALDKVGCILTWTPLGPRRRRWVCESLDSPQPKPSSLTLALQGYSLFQGRVTQVPTWNQLTERGWVGCRAQRSSALRRRHPAGTRSRGSGSSLAFCDSGEASEGQSGSVTL